MDAHPELLYVLHRPSGSSTSDRWCSRSHAFAADKRCGSIPGTVRPTLPFTLDSIYTLTCVTVSPGKRHRIALELWTTEQTYIKALQQCTQIRKRLESHQPKPILGALEIKAPPPRLSTPRIRLKWLTTINCAQTIFSETETILLYATVLEGKMRQQLEHWHVDQTLAHVFTEIVPPPPPIHFLRLPTHMHAGSLSHSHF